MPQLSLFSWIVWLGSIVLQPALVYRMLTSGLWRRWPSVFTFLTLNSLLFLCQLAVFLSPFLGHSNVAIYFDLYWIGAGVSTAIEAWMIAEIACTMIAASDRIHRWVNLAVFSLCTSYLLASIELASHVSTSFAWRLTRVVVSLDRATSLAWLATFLCVAVFCDLVGLQWNRRTLGLAIGFALIAGNEVFLGWLLSSLTLKLLSDIHEAMYLVALLVWSVTLLQKDPTPEPLPSIDGLRDVIGIYRTFTKRIRAI